ncbi:hypothetical protein C1H46_031441 [Malus baccata]|uniref:Uncharacterized protein n=1 Tax=Malus baccata TaxID=106549 RepID=A0A540L948_MALBA|nr:hypothetical protein C1H46_031441 [Malus baccata]
MVGDARDDEDLEPLHEADSDNGMLICHLDEGPVIHGSDDMHYFPPHSANHFEFLDYLREGEGPSNPLLSTMYMIISGGTGRQQQICIPIALTDIAQQVEVIDLSIVIADFMKRFEGFAAVAIQREERERFMEKVVEEGFGEVQFINPKDFPSEGPHRSALAKTA